MSDTSGTDPNLANAVKAGWDPSDGDPPFEHGEFQEGIAAGTDLEALASVAEDDK